MSRSRSSSAVFKTALFSGCGGGADMINAYLVSCLFKGPMDYTSLGSVRPIEPNQMDEKKSRFADAGFIVTKETNFTYPGRCFEPLVCQELDCGIELFSTKADEKKRIEKLRSAISFASEYKNFLFFVDGGGDSLILEPTDGNKSTQDTDPFVGTDAELLEAVSGIDNAYLVVVSPGIDIDYNKFEKNIELMKEIDAYCGAINPLTGETKDLAPEIDLYFSTKFIPAKITKYQKLVKNVLVLDEKDLTEEKKKLPSMTATVTYSTFFGSPDVERVKTYVKWEPKDGVVLQRDHFPWIHFFKAGGIYDLKKQLVNTTTNN